MNISQMEPRPDWKLIAESVPCPKCGATPCRNMGANPGTLLASQPRNDYHYERKQAAVLAWQEFRQLPKSDVTPVTENK